jgi:hypothetical protein
VKRDALNTYTLFKERLRESYLPPDYDSRLPKDLYGRTQGEGERIVDFLTCHSGMNRRLRQPLSETDLTELAYENLNPDFLCQIPSRICSSMRELMQFGCALEGMKARRDHYRPPSLPFYMLTRSSGSRRPE